MKTSVGIIGVTGYAGQELLGLLLRHPGVSVEYLGSRQVKGAEPVGELLPAFRGVKDLRVERIEISRAAKRCRLLFLALPHGVAMTLAPQILRKSSCRLIDLSGDFRLNSAEDYRRAYHLRHSAPSLLKEAVYGLTEWNRDRIVQAALVANPGCYPTAALLGAAPLAKAGLLDRQGIVVDAKSGVTGAGRALKEELLFTEVNEDLRAYKVNTHQHIPEMEQELQALSGRPVGMTFVPHLVPLNRGLYASIYAPVTKPMTQRRLRALYEEAYRDEPFVQVLPEGVWPQIRSVAGTNRCELGLTWDPKGKRAVLLTAIDNLGKGAAGQAVQNMNLTLGLPETEGLIPAQGT